MRKPTTVVATDELHTEVHNWEPDCSVQAQDLSLVTYCVRSWTILVLPLLHMYNHLLLYADQSSLPAKANKRAMVMRKQFETESQSPGSIQMHAVHVKFKASLVSSEWLYSNSTLCRAVHTGYLKNGADEMGWCSEKLLWNQARLRGSTWSSHHLMDNR